MLYSVPERDSANVAQSPPRIAPMSLVVMLLPRTSMANSSTPFGPPEEVV
jgi:hypothetical protein